MKVTVNEKPSKTYPYLGISDNGCVVLFEEEKKGVCLVKGETNNDVGGYSSMWGESMFKPFTGEIVMSNG